MSKKHPQPPFLDRIQPAIKKVTAMKPTLTAINLQALEAGLTEGHRLAAATHAAPETIAQIIERLRLLTEDHTPDGWPAVRMRDITALIAHIDGHHSEDDLEMVGRWYMVTQDGAATLCVDHEDAEAEARKADREWPRNGPHRAVQLVEAQATALARTVMLDQVSLDRKPDCYGIRQITDDEGVEEWEDIRTSPDVAREEANDMMATGRGEIYEVVPLWTTPQLAPQPAPAPLSDDVVKDAARYRLVRRGQYWGVIDGIGNTLRAEELDAAVNAARARLEEKP